jgi:hypothetical protein
MFVRTAGRWACIFALVSGTAVVAASCGGAGNASVFNGNGDGGGDATSSSSSGGSGSGSGSILPEGGLTGGGDGSTGGCTPKTCAQLGYDCGPNSDGCGNVIMCGSCTKPAYCGGGGYSKCGGGTGFGPDGGVQCTPTTCQKLGFDCGPAGDGCGGLLQCGMCSNGDICGAQSPSVCGTGGPTCTGLCKQQVACDAGIPTTITGRVVAGTIPTYGTPDPVPGVLVYVPNAPLQPFQTGVSCGCPPVTGNPLVWTTTAVDGTFTLKNVPVGSNIPVAIQLGRWRREVTFNVTTACASSAVGDIRMPRNRTDGLGNQADIPLTALSTGTIDAMECVLLKMGVDAAEFTDPAASTGQRIHLHVGNGANGPGGMTQETTLTSSLPTLEKYDQVIFPCWASPVDKPAADLANMVSYTSAGGRMFATHFSYTWLYTNVPFSQTATWVADNEFTSVTGDIDTSFARGATFGQWMTLVGAAAGTPPAFNITSPRSDFTNPVPPSLRYVYADDPTNGNYPLHYTFDTPWMSQNTCGRVEYSDFHVSDYTSIGTFPTECTTNPTTGVACSAAAPCPLDSQEKALEYMIWDLGQCLTPQMPTCTPLTCADQHIGCGPAGDGCGNEIMCGTCTPPQTCGGGGPNQCGYPEAGSCVPTTCQKLGIQCGPAGDGCGGLLQCGTCTAPQTCGGGGTPGKCGGSGSQ